MFFYYCFSEGEQTHPNARRGIMEGNGIIPRGRQAGAAETEVRPRGGSRRTTEEDGAKPLERRQQVAPDLSEVEWNGTSLIFFGGVVMP